MSGEQEAVDDVKTPWSDSLSSRWLTRMRSHVVAGGFACAATKAPVYLVFGPRASIICCSRESRPHVSSRRLRDQLFTRATSASGMPRNRNSTRTGRS